MFREFFEFIDNGTCPYTVVANMKEELLKNDFEELSFDVKWNLKKGGKYYLDVYNTTLIAFTVGNNYNTDGRINIAVAHTDSPCFVVKPNSFIKSGKYAKINVESYGGAILNTWLDRPLGVAGIVVTKGDDPFNPNVKVIDSKKAVMVIPNLCIHFNRDVNKGVELNKQKDMIPLCGMIEEGLENDQYLLNYLADYAGVDKEDILDYHLYLYNIQKASFTGFKDEMITAPRIDNLVSVYACLKAVLQENDTENINVIAVFDNEEVGSRTKQGAASQVVADVLSRISNCFGHDYLNSNGMILSLDGAHAIHPNSSEKYDPTNPVYLNDGVVIKKSANQSYGTDAVSSAVIKELCIQNNIPYKEFVNKSDMPGGSTLGAIASTNIPYRVADVGIPMLAMHSALETMGSEDLTEIIRLTKRMFR